MVEYVLFDLDDTLYPPAAGLMLALSRRMTRYMVEQLGLNRNKANLLRRQYNQKYGSTTRGLALHHDVDLKHFLQYAHDLPIEKYLKQDRDLECLLNCILVKRGIFTNAPQFYTEKVLEVLGIKTCFSEIFALEFSDYQGKPDEVVYSKIISHLDIEPESLMMLDDALLNLVPAKQLKWITIWVNRDPQMKANRADFAVSDLWQVAHIFQQVGILDEAHRNEWDRCLSSCPLGNRKSNG